jgi:hypothetical protein
MFANDPKRTNPTQYRLLLAFNLLFYDYNWRRTWPQGEVTRADAISSKLSLAAFIKGQLRVLADRSQRLPPNSAEEEHCEWLRTLPLEQCQFWRKRRELDSADLFRHQCFSVLCIELGTNPSGRTGTPDKPRSTGQKGIRHTCLH